jgi:putative endonuclease
LEGRGWRVVTRNWKGRAGEIDLVCEEGDTLVFVEVKTRSSSRFGTPEEAVDVRKLKRMKRAAAEYVAREVVDRGRIEPPCRLDVVAVDLRSDGHVAVRLMQGVEPP